MDDISKIIDAGKEKGYLPDNEVNELIPHDVHSAQDVDDLLATIRTQGLDVVEGELQLPWSILEQKLAKEAEDGELDLTPGAPETANDPVRIYLRELGVVPVCGRSRRIHV